MPTPFSVYTRTSKFLQRKEKQTINHEDRRVRKAASYRAVSIAARLSKMENDNTSQPPSQLIPMPNNVKTNGQQCPRERTKIGHAHLLPSCVTHVPRIPSIMNFGRGHPPLNIEGEPQLKGITLSQLTMPEFGSNSQNGGDATSVQSNSMHFTSDLSILHQSSSNSATTHDSAWRYLQNMKKNNTSIMKAQPTASHSLQMSQSTRSATDCSFDRQTPIVLPRAQITADNVESRTPARQQRSWMIATTPHRHAPFATPKALRNENSENVNQIKMATPKVGNGRVCFCDPRNPKINSDSLPGSDTNNDTSCTDTERSYRSSGSGISSALTTQLEVPVCDTAGQSCNNDTTKQIQDIQELVAIATKQIQTLTESFDQQHKRHIDEMKAAKDLHNCELEKKLSDSTMSLNTAGACQIKSLERYSASLRKEEDEYRCEAFKEEKANLIQACIPIITEKAGDIIKIALGGELVINKVHDVMTSFKDSVINQITTEVYKIFAISGIDFGRSMRLPMVSKLPEPAPLAKNPKSNMKVATTKKRLTHVVPLVSTSARRSKRLRSSASAPPMEDVSNHCITPYGKTFIERKSGENSSEILTALSQSPVSLICPPTKERAVKCLTNQPLYSTWSNDLDIFTSTRSTFISSDDESVRRYPRKLKLDHNTGVISTCENFTSVEPFSVETLSVIPCTPNSKCTIAKSSEKFDEPIRIRSKKSKRGGQTYQRTHNRRVHSVEDCFSFLDY